jgi:alpha-L-arabinofuranosidase
VVSRREVLTGAAGSLGVGLFGQGTSAMSLSRSTIDVFVNEPQGLISPDLYGYLLENLGTVIYDGVWVGEKSSIPNVHGIRATLIERLRDIKASVIRWPGGNFADYYDWRDGVGPKVSRPRRTNVWSDLFPARAPSGPQRYDPNEFGTAEFMRLCELSGGRPCLSANVHGLTPQDFTRWVEYCNSPAASTTLADLRQGDGSLNPYGVRYWGIGNEVWAAGGNMTVADYASLYKRFTVNVPRYGQDLKFIACGGPPPSIDPQWVRQFLSLCRSALLPVPIAALSLHYYATNPLEEMHPGQTVEQFLTAGDNGESLLQDAAQFDDRQWYEVLAKSVKIEEVIGSWWQAMEESDPTRKIKIAVDEWGAFYKSGTELSSVNIRGRAVTLRDALAAALTLDIFNRNAEKLLLANFTGLINQEGGLFRAQGAQFVATPIYHVFALYAAHQGGRALRTQFDAPPIHFAPSEASPAISALSGSASLTGNILTLTVVNPHVSQHIEPLITIHSGVISSASVTTLTSSSIRAHNTFEDPDRVRPVTTELKVGGQSFRWRFPAASVNRCVCRIG